MTVEVNCLPHDWVTRERCFGALLGHTCIDLKIAHYAPVLKGYTTSQSAMLRKIYPMDLPAPCVCKPEVDTIYYH